MVIQLRDFGSRPRLVTRLGPPNLLPGVLSSGLQTQDPLPRAFTRLVHRLGFTAAYPANYPAPTSQLVTRRPLEWSTNARPITLYPEHLPGRCVRWGSRQLAQL